ncbi:hypothetical protein BC628DRAFT_1401616 [Trametes gibbosa]|nr:hypothetical protein BC628DRAFT_1401616 [Trametes gibbosa]
MFSCILAMVISITDPSNTFLLFGGHIYTEIVPVDLPAGRLATQVGGTCRTKFAFDESRLSVDAADKHQIWVQNATNLFVLSIFLLASTALKNIP